MTRTVALAALLLAGTALSAPVPKAIKRQAAPPLLGTTWVGENSGQVRGSHEYTFGEGGKFSATTNGKPYTGGTWKQDGETVEWEFNNRFSVYTVTYKDGVFEGTATNRQGKTWNVTLRPVAK